MMCMSGRAGGSETDRRLQLVLPLTVDLIQYLRSKVSFPSQTSDLAIPDETRTRATLLSSTPLNVSTDDDDRRDL